MPCFPTELAWASGGGTLGFVPCDTLEAPELPPSWRGPAFVASAAATMAEMRATPPSGPKLRRSVMSPAGHVPDPCPKRTGSSSTTDPRPAQPWSKATGVTLFHRVTHPAFPGLQGTQAARAGRRTGRISGSSIIRSHCLMATRPGHREARPTRRRGQRATEATAQRSQTVRQPVWGPGLGEGALLPQALGLLSLYSLALRSARPRRADGCRRLPAAPGVWRFKSLALSRSRDCFPCWDPRRCLHPSRKAKSRKRMGKVMNKQTLPPLASSAPARRSATERPVA